MRADGLAAFGVFASVIVLTVSLGSLIFPEYAGTSQYGWIPMSARRWA
jgi:hypothetical protein